MKFSSSLKKTPLFRSEAYVDCNIRAMFSIFAQIGQFVFLILLLPWAAGVDTQNEMASLNSLCSKTCNTTYASQFMDDCLKHCPDCNNLPLLKNTEEEVIKQNERSSELVENCHDICAPREDPVQDILCQMKCPRTWCGTRITLLPTGVPSQHEDTYSHTGNYIYILAGIGALAAVVVLVAFAFRYRKRVNTFIRQMKSKFSERRAPEDPEGADIPSLPHTTLNNPDAQCPAESVPDSPEGNKMALMPKDIDIA